MGAVGEDRALAGSGSEELDVLLLIEIRQTVLQGIQWGDENVFLSGQYHLHVGVGPVGLVLADGTGIVLLDVGVCAGRSKVVAPQRQRVQIFAGKKVCGGLPLGRICLDAGGQLLRIGVFRYGQCGPLPCDLISCAGCKQN